MKSKGIAVPYVIWMAIFVVAPLLIIVFYAFTSQAGGFTLENFSTMAQYTGVFGRSFLLAIIATFICLLIGYPLSYWLAQESPAVRRVAMMLIMLPMWMNFLLRTYSWMFLLEKRGLINSFLGLFGIGPFQMINTQGAVVLGMVYNFLPFMILPILSVLEKIDPKVIEAAGVAVDAVAQGRSKGVLVPGVPLLLLVEVGLDMGDEGAHLFVLVRVAQQARPFVEQHQVFILIDDVQVGLEDAQKGVLLPGLLEELVVDV